MKAPRLPFATCRFTLSGLNLERFMNLTGKENLPLLGARRANQRTMVCRCFTADMPAIRALAEDKGWRVDAVTPLGLSAWLCWLRARPGAWVGAVLALLLTTAALQFVWEVRVAGAGPYRADIAAYLADAGLAPGTPRALVDAAAVEGALYRRYPQVAWFHVYVSNVTLVVDCALGVPPPVLPDPRPGDIAAARDGVVDALRVYAGTALVKAGDVVRKGQVLIAGQERGRDGQIVETAARGVVTARCWRSHTVRMPLYDVKSWETGRAVCQTVLCTPWFSFPAAPEKPEYLGYNTYHTDVPLGGAFVPLWRRTVERREVTMEYEARDVDAVREEAVAAAFQRLKTSLRGYEIIDKWVDYCMIEGDDTLAVSVVAEWRTDIGQTES